jgi:hypothetical protein
MTGLRAAIAVAILLGFCGAAAGCSSRGGAVQDAALPTPPDLDATPMDVAVVCMDAAAPDAVEAATPTGPSTCGGEVAVGGATPYGTFVATNISAQLGFGDCAGLSLTLDDGAGGDAGQADEAIVVSAFVIEHRVSSTGTTYVGSGTITRGSHRSGLVPITVELTTTDFSFDGGAMPPNGAGPVGLVVGTIDVDTGCGHVTGTFAVPVCSWQTCVL